MYRVAVTEHFDAAHRIVGHQGGCANLHGHRITVVPEFSGTHLDELGILVDFKVVKSELRKLIALVDHTYLNENEVISFNPTAENLAKWFYQRLKETLEPTFRCLYKSSVELSSVKIFESPDCWAEYSEG